MNKTCTFLLIMLLVIFSLACSVTSLLPDSGQAEATAVALQATQVALEMKIIELQQQQTAIAEQPTQAEVEAHAAPLEGQEVVFEDIRFVYPPSVAAGVDPANKAEMEDMVGTIPAHVEFTFNSYVWDGSMHTPIIYVYSTDAYRAANEYAAEDIDQLNTLLFERPANPENIPFLPMWNAGQMFASNIEYMEFQNGIGVRFLTQYGQDVSPVNNNGLFYTFQGLTNDGQWYVSAVFPVSHATLPPAGDQVPGGDWEAFSNNYITYIGETEAMLNVQTNESFYPDLSELDGIIESLQVK